MGFGKFLGIATEVGGIAGIPGFAQANAIKDAVAASKASKAEKEALLAQIEQLKAEQAAAAKPVPKGLLEGKRSQYMLIGILATIAVQYGLPQDVADGLTQWIAGLVGAGILGETARPSMK